MKVDLVLLFEGGQFMACVIDKDKEYDAVTAVINCMEAGGNKVYQVHGYPFFYRADKVVGFYVRPHIEKSATERVADAFEKSITEGDDWKGS